MIIRLCKPSSFALHYHQLCLPVPSLSSPNMYNGYGTAAMNNPFAPDPNGAQNRWPDLNSGVQPGMPSPMQYPQPPQQYMQQQQPGVGYGNMSPTYTGYMSPTQSLSPQQTSGFGQPWMGSAPTAPQVSGSSYSYLYGQNGQQQQPAFSPAQQQVHNNPGYIAQLDPYASIGQAGWDGGAPSSSSTAPQQQSQSSIPTTSPGPSGQQHPREYIRTHKAEIEAWDTYAWKQFIGTFDTVKDAWATRKRELEQNIQQFTMQMQYGGGGYHPMQLQQEISRLQGVGSLSCLRFKKLTFPLAREGS